MLIAVNTRLLIPGKLDGIGRFTFESLQRITNAHPEHEFVFLFDRKISEDFIFSENVTPVKLMPPARRAFLFDIWFNWSVAGVLRDLKADLFVSPEGILPKKMNCPSLAVIHDLNFVHYPNDIPSNFRNYYQQRYPRFARQATRIATVSEFSKQDIVKTYGIDASKIDVVYNGASDGFVPLDEAGVERIRGLFSDGDPYFLFVGSLHPRKNIVRLLKAFEQFRESKSFPHKLLIVGHPSWGNDELDATLKSMKHREHVVFTGRIPPRALHEVMASAFALAYVPYFEGFGIPIVEAMQSGVPVITSNVTSMPEVAGDAALLCDPFSVDSIAQQMIAIASDDQLRRDLIRKGNERKSVFTWNRTAQLFYDSMMKTIRS